MASRPLAQLDPYRDYHLALVGELDRVAEQVDEDLAQARDVAEDARSGTSGVDQAGQLQPFLGGLMRQQVERDFDAACAGRTAAAPAPARPASILEKSRMSLMIVSRASPLARMVSTNSRCSSGQRGVEQQARSCR